MTERIYRVPDRVDLSNAVYDLLEQTVDDAILKHYDSKSDETLIECLICGDWEGHKIGCPVPVIQKWLNEGASPK